MCTSHTPSPSCQEPTAAYYKTNKWTTAGGVGEREGQKTERAICKLSIEWVYAITSILSQFFQSQRAADEEKLAHYSNLKKLGVDLTSYFVSQNPKPEHIIRVITDGADSESAVHIHP